MAAPPSGCAGVPACTSAAGALPRSGHGWRNSAVGRPLKALMGAFRRLGGRRFRRPGGAAAAPRDGPHPAPLATLTTSRAPRPHRLATLWLAMQTNTDCRLAGALAE